MRSTILKKVGIRSALVKVFLLKNQLSRSKLELKSRLKPGPLLSEKVGPSVENLK